MPSTSRWGIFSSKRPSTIGCIDFGTAFSKVAIVDAEATEDLDADSLHPLPIGEGMSANPYLLPSLLFISETAVLFGAEAEAAARRSERRGRSAFLSPKQYLSTHALDELDEKLSGDIDPTGDYTARELITLYLAFVLKRSADAAKMVREKWPTKLRLTRPAWASERAEWGERTLRLLVRHAFILADEFDERLVGKGGISHLDVRSALKEIPDTAEFPDADIFELTDQGTATIPEATAVAAGSIRPTGRRIVVVADIGGGTSDFAAFMTGLRGRNVVAELQGSAFVLRQAGDFLDMQLRRILLEKAGLLADDPAARGPASALRARQRVSKEVLFTQGKLVEEVGDRFISIQLEEFLEDNHVKAFSDQLEKTFLQSVKIAVDCAKSLSTSHSKVPVQIMSTGGGHSLPMVNDMIRNLDFDWSFSRISPEVFQSQDADFNTVIPQLTVSIGGAVRDMPRQTSPYRTV